jgi:hypothetical protein
MIEPKGKGGLISTSNYVSFFGVKKTFLYGSSFSCTSGDVKDKKHLTGINKEEVNKETITIWRRFFATSKSEDILPIQPLGRKKGKVSI